MYYLPRLLGVLFMFIMLVGFIALTYMHWRWLADYRLAGPAVIGEIFFAVAIIGVNAQLSTEEGKDQPAAVIFFRFFLLLMQLSLAILFFITGGWLLVVGVNIIIAPHVPGWLTGIIYIAAFTWYVAGYIKILEKLSDLEIIGPVSDIKRFKKRRK